MMMLAIAAQDCTAIDVLFTPHILPHPANSQDCVIETTEICA